MLIQAFPSGPILTNAYVVACAKTREAAVIDPAPFSFKDIQNYLNQHNLNLKKILLTHSHWDHITDIRHFKENYPVSVHVHKLDALNLQQPGSDGVFCLLSLSPIQPDVLCEDGMKIPVGLLTFEVIHTPGHSPGSACWYEPTQGILFSGDTLFQGTIGNVSFPTSDPSLMWLSLDKLAKLPQQTKVYTGHGPTTTIAAESSWLPHAKRLFDNNGGTT